MKRILIIGIVLLVLLSGLVIAPLPPAPDAKEGAPATTVKGTAEAPKNVVKVDKGVYMAKDDLSSYLNEKTECSSTLKDKCWSIEKNELRTKNLANPYKSGVTYNPQNGRWKSGDLVEYYSDDGIISVAYNENEDIYADVYVLNSRGEYETKASLQIDKIDENSIAKPQNVKGQPFVTYSINGEKKVSLGAAQMPEQLYDQIKGSIDYSKETTETEITLQNGKVTLDDKSGVTKAEITVLRDGAKDVSASETRWYLPQGADKQLLSSKDGWKQGDNPAKLENSQTNERLSFFDKDSDGAKGFTHITDDGARVVRITEKQRIVEQYDKGGVPESYEIFVGGKVVARAVEFLDYKQALGRLVINPGLDRPGIDKLHRYDADGRLIGVCRLGVCMRNPENEQNYWVTNDAVCIGAQSTCVVDGKVDAGSALTQSEDVICGKANVPDQQACQAIQDKEQEMFFNFEGGFWDTALGKTEFAHFVEQWVAPARPGWQGISNWLLPDVTKEWNKKWVEQFDQVLLVDYVVPAAVCDYDGLYQTENNVVGSSATFIEVAPGTVQFVGSIQAEKSSTAGPAFCGEELPCSQGKCSSENVCEAAGKVVEARFYKITWAVQAPADEKKTPYRDEDGIAIKYNIQLRGPQGTIWLYPDDAPGSDESLTLENGALDRDTFIAFSPNQYTRVCILFGAPPQDLKGNEVKEICTDFKESAQGFVDWEKAGGASGSSGSATVDEAGRKQI